jgi:hypothetical protein
MPHAHTITQPDPAGKVFVSEVCVNKDRGYRFGGAEPYDTGRTFAQLASVFRDLQREYGRCVSRVYLDNPEDEARPHVVGWVFEKRMRYEDAPAQSYTREVWVSVHVKPQVVTTTEHLAELA